MDFVVENWDDLRVFLCTVRAGSIAAAARELRVDPTTISRRMAAFEDSFGSKLFDRLKGGVILSPTGEVVLRGASEAEHAIHARERAGSSRDEELRGTVRIAVAELLAFAVVDEFKRLVEEFPSISFQFVCSDEMHNLSKREADVAIRVTEHPPPYLVGRRLGRLETGVYAAKALEEASIRTVPWIGWSGLEEHEGVVGEVRRRAEGRGPFSVHADSYGMIVEFARSGMGATVLPKVFGESDPTLVRLYSPDTPPAALWVLTHP
ncbi:MAG: LysR family transcriptional regulator, partial [Myxococcota bacterium]